VVTIGGPTLAGLLLRAGLACGCWTFSISVDHEKQYGPHDFGASHSPIAQLTFGKNKALQLARTLMTPPLARNLRREFFAIFQLQTKH